MAETEAGSVPARQHQNSGAGARARRNVPVPSLQMAEILGRPDFRPGRQIDGRQAADVGDRKVWSADKCMVGQAGIEPYKEMLKPKTPSLRERRNLFQGHRTGQGSALQPGSGI